MKKVLWLIVCLMTMVVSVNAQSNETQETYCMIVGTQKFLSSKCTFTIDYGQETRWIDGDRKMKMVDEDGKTIKFNSLMDACNHLASMGWTLVNAYAMIDNKQGSCYHYVFKKIINKGEVVTFNTKGNTAKVDRQRKGGDDLYN
jgi:hypothetical protein